MGCSNGIPCERALTQVLQLMLPVNGEERSEGGEGVGTKR